MTYVLDDHHEEGKLDSEGFLGVHGARDVVSGDVGSHDLEHGRLNVGVRDSLDVAVAHLLVPNLKGLRPAHTPVSLRWPLTQWSRGWRGIHSGRCS